MKDLTSTGTQNLGAAISMMILATLAVALRLVFRFTLKQTPTLSDALIVLSLAFGLAWYGVNIHYITRGPGPASYDLTQILENVQIGGLTWGNALMKTIYLGEIFFCAAISAAKLSILDMYQRIFGISIPFRRFNWFMNGVVLFFWVLFTFLFIFSCHPVDIYWNLVGRTGHCLSDTKLLFSFEFTNLFVDLVMLGMPPAMISQLNLPKEKKWSVCGILLLGGMVCIVSMVRLSYIWNPASSSNLKNLSATMITSDVQLGLAILCACLPTYTPLLRLFNQTLHSSLRKGSSKKTYDYLLKPSKESHQGKNINSNKTTDSKTIVAPHSGLDSMDYTLKGDSREDFRGMNSMSSHTATHDATDRV